MAVTSQSTIVRSEQAKDNELLVIAESSLVGERATTWFRVMLMILISVSQAAFGRLEGYVPPNDPLRVTVIAIYIFLAIGTAFGLRRTTPNPRRAMVAGLIMMAVDFSFTTFMGFRDWQNEHRFDAEQLAIVNAVVLCFSISRISWIHIVLSTLIACASFAGVSLYAGQLTIVLTGFVIGGYLTLGALILFTNRRMRQMFVDLRKRDNLTRFLPPQVAERVLRHGDAALAPVQREVTVLFSDIRDFTALSEALPPRAVLAFLDEYLGHLAHLVKAHEGVVNKFLGDGMLAFWGVPELRENHAELALRAALDMRRIVEELNAVRTQAGLAPIRIGIGIHSGTVAAGMLGGADQHEYTVIGDAVNVASRVEGLTKTLAVDILVSESTWRQVDGRFRGQRISEEHVKGRAEPVVVYSLEGQSDRAAPASVFPEATGPARGRA